MKAAVVALLLVGVVAVSAQIQVCDNKLKPGQVSMSSIKMTTTNSGSYSDLNLNWPRPKDSLTSGGLDSCITFYDVKIIRKDGKAIQSAKVDVTPAHTSASYRAAGLNPGETYTFEIRGVGPAGQGATNTPKYTTASKPPVTAVPL